MKMSRISSVLAVAMIAAAALVGSGCALLEKIADPKNDLIEQVAIQYATGKFIEAEKDSAKRTARAGDVVKVAKDLKAVATSDSATVDALQALALKKIVAAKLQPADNLLATALVTAAVQELKDKVSAGVLSPDARVAVDKLLDWVIGAATAYS